MFKNTFYWKNRTVCDFYSFLCWLTLNQLGEFQYYFCILHGEEHSFSEYIEQY